MEVGLEDHEAKGQEIKSWTEGSLVPKNNGIKRQTWEREPARR